MNIPVVTVGESTGDLVTGLERLRGPVTVVRRCSELTELIAACQTGLARAAILASESGEVTGSLVARLAESEVAVVVLTDDYETRLRLDGLGVRHVSSSVNASELASAVEESVHALKIRPRTRDVKDYGATADALTDLPLTQEAQQAEGPSQRGAVTTVWGPYGAPGRTTIAVNLAAELAASGRNVLLIDADTYGASVAASLGLLDETAGLAHACRLADQGSLDTSSLARVSTEVAISGGRLRVLTGITRPDRWAELRASAFRRVLEEARALVDDVVIDCSFCLEADEELSFDTMAPRRNGATLVALESADTVLAIGSADSIGMPRLVRALSQLSQAVPTASPRVLFNRVRASAVGRSPERQLREAWERFGPQHAIESFLPADETAADEALLAGSVLLEAAPDSRLREAIAAVAGIGVSRIRRAARSGRSPK
ncbi:AAA family ATPase [Arthrobacter roseus]|uniref:AAA family ATPase n=1 Tax=Arthrobacter roseus TaxID=136274 RepID=UPI001964DA1C|nr:AAA family ATPase [Arthrobacter roseus]MBM7849103.1 Mrp family chromosome partitioning ATPase [Arthrobacter roseus]